MLNSEETNCVHMFHASSPLSQYECDSKYILLWHILETKFADFILYIWQPKEEQNILVLRHISLEVATCRFRKK